MNAVVYITCPTRRASSCQTVNISRDRAGKRPYSSPSDAHRYVYTKRYRRRHPRRASAHIAVGVAIRNGTLVRPAACPRCGAVVKVQAHHDDYSKPLVVRWMCRACHWSHHVAMAKALTVQQCAERLNFAEQFVRRLLGAGKLPGSKIGGEWRVDPEHLEAFIAGHRPNQPESTERDRQLPPEATSRYA